MARVTSDAEIALLKEASRCITRLALIGCLPYGRVHEAANLARHLTPYNEAMRIAILLKVIENYRTTISEGYANLRANLLRTALVVFDVAIILGAFGLFVAWHP